MKSVAVLPFVNMSADGDNEYFCDGLAEELLNALSKIDALKVAARTSAFSFKGKSATVSTIARTLGVNNIVEGSIRRSGNRLRISVQLVNAADGYQLWSERYDREMSDIFALQDEITLAVVAALKVTFFGSEKAAVLQALHQGRRRLRVVSEGPLSREHVHGAGLDAARSSVSRKRSTGNPTTRWPTPGSPPRGAANGSSAFFPPNRRFRRARSPTARHWRLTTACRNRICRWR